MNIPPWLANMTGAWDQAKNPANGFMPTMGDALQGIGHSMATYARTGGPPGGADLSGLKPVGGAGAMGMPVGGGTPAALMGLAKLLPGLLGGGSGAPAPMPAPAPATAAPPPAPVAPIDFGAQGQSIGQLMQHMPVSALSGLFK